MVKRFCHRAEKHWINAVHVPHEDTTDGIATKHVCMTFVLLTRPAFSEQSESKSCAFQER